MSGVSHGGMEMRSAAPRAASKGQVFLARPGQLQGAGSSFDEAAPAASRQVAVHPADPFAAATGLRPLNSRYLHLRGGFRIEG